jgi:hypothetical protein
MFTLSLFIMQKSFSVYEYATKKARAWRDRFLAENKSVILVSTALSGRADLFKGKGAGCPPIGSGAFAPENLWHSPLFGETAATDCADMLMVSSQSRKEAEMRLCTIR